jgi:hypothetical protein
MTKITLSAIGVASSGSERPLSKGQKSFNALIGKIEKRRAALAEWEAFGTDFQRRYNDEFVPLRTSFDAVRIQLVHRLDRSYDTKGLTKVERQTIVELISHIAGDLLASVDDPAIAELYRRYCAADAEAESAALEDLRKTLETTFGVDIADDVDLGSPDEVFRHVQEQIDQQDERERKHREAREEYHAKRKKAPKRGAAEERARTEQAEVHLSLREVYRKLASMLHPDREIDPVERERKAALMQRVNMAYGSRSLLDLLEIQLELEHIDQATLDNISEDRLKRWNTILKEQLRGLDQELAEVEVGFLARCGMSPMLAASPKTIKRALTTNIINLREYIKAFELDLRVFDDGKRLKPWLKRMKWELAGQ